MHAIDRHPALELLVIAAGSHLIPPAETFRQVKAAFPVADSIPMQRPGPSTRFDDAQATGRGIARFARSYELLKPDWVLVLGDRIEAFAAASAASIAGVPLAHIHGGDRAAGIADEAMRHAITKLAHLHFPATELSKTRILNMGEDPDCVVVVGSPAIDDLAVIQPLDTKDWEQLGTPGAVILMHPIGRHEEEEEAAASATIQATLQALSHQSIVLLDPNADPGRRGIQRACDQAAREHADRVVRLSHLPREQFVGLLKRLADHAGVLIGNSSAGLIEAAALGLPVVNIGLRQTGRQQAANVVDVAHETTHAIASGIMQARSLDLTDKPHPYGQGDAGLRIANHLAQCNPNAVDFTRKVCTY